MNQGTWTMTREWPVPYLHHVQVFSSFIYASDKWNRTEAKNTAPLDFAPTRGAWTVALERTENKPGQHAFKVDSGNPLDWHLHKHHFIFNCYQQKKPQSNLNYRFYGTTAFQSSTFIVVHPQQKWPPHRNGHLYGHTQLPATKINKTGRFYGQNNNFS